MLWVGAVEQRRADSSCSSSLEAARVARTAFGSKPGIEAIARTAPGRGLDRDQRRRRALGVGDRRLQAVGRDPLRLGVERQRDVGALRLLVAELVDDRGELVLLADQQVVLGELDPGAADLDEAVADRVAEQRALRVAAHVDRAAAAALGQALGDQHAVGGGDRAARDLLLLDQRAAVLGACASSSSASNTAHFEVK